MSERAVDEAYSDLVSDQSRGCLLLLVLMNEHVACLLAGGRENVMLITTTDPRNNPAPNDMDPETNTSDYGWGLFEKQD